MTKVTFTQQLNDFLQQQSPEQVTQWLLHTITADKTLKKQWQITLLLASGKTSDYKKLLTQALPKKELLVTPNLWRKVALYFDDAEALFELAFEQLDQNGNVRHTTDFRAIYGTIAQRWWNQPNPWKGAPLIPFV